MRKYQQLILLVISCISLIVLFVYKSENNRLKYVLQVVNFFSRKDAAFFNEFENFPTYLNHPLPTWQALDNSFHAYAAYWQDTTALADVVGKRDANVVFSCYLQFENGSIIKGKFRFQPWGQQLDAGDKFINYKFFCQPTSAISLSSQVESVKFIHAADKSSSGMSLQLRMLRTLNNATLQAPAVCLDFTASTYDHNQRQFLKHDKFLTQFFLHHKALGMKHFLIYNGNAISMRFLSILKKAKIQYYLLPFNFPYDINNVTSTRVRKIIQLDCARRSAIISNYTIVLRANEFLYVKSNIDSNNSILNSSALSDKSTDFHVTTIDVCLDVQKPLLMDNNLYDGTRAEDKTTVIYSMSRNELHKKDVKLTVNVAFIHAYTFECPHINEDGLSDWRHRLRADFSNFLLKERTEMSMFFK